MSITAVTKTLDLRVPDVVDLHTRLADFVREYGNGASIPPSAGASSPMTLLVSEREGSFHLEVRSPKRTHFVISTDGQSASVRGEKIPSELKTDPNYLSKLASHIDRAASSRGVVRASDSEGLARLEVARTLSTPVPISGGGTIPSIPDAQPLLAAYLRECGIEASARGDERLVRRVTEPASGGRPATVDPMHIYFRGPDGSIAVAKMPPPRAEAICGESFTITPTSITQFAYDSDRVVATGEKALAALNDWLVQWHAAS